MGIVLSYCCVVYGPYRRQLCSYSVLYPQQEDCCVGVWSVVALYWRTRLRCNVHPYPIRSEEKNVASNAIPRSRRERVGRLSRKRRGLHTCLTSRCSRVYSADRNDLLFRASQVSQSSPAAMVAQRIAGVGGGGTPVSGGGRPLVEGKRKPA